MGRKDLGRGHWGCGLDPTENSILSFIVDVSGLPRRGRNVSALSLLSLNQKSQRPLKTQVLWFVSCPSMFWILLEISAKPAVD